MKADKAIKEKPVSVAKTSNKWVNPFIKLMKDQEHIAVAIDNNQLLSSLKDIKFVRL